MNKFPVFVATLLGLAVLSASAAPRNKPSVQPQSTNAISAGPNVVAKPTAQSPLPPAISGIGVVAEAAAASGVRRCLARIDQVVNFLSAGAQTGAMVFAPPVDADNRQASVGIEVLGANGLSYVDTAYAPSANGCDAMYAQVTYWNEACPEIALTAFAAFARSNPMREHIAVLDGGPSAKIFLMPAGSGCVSIKKEVMF